MKKMRCLAVLCGVFLLAGCSAFRKLPPPEAFPTIPPETTVNPLPQFAVTRSGRVLEQLWHFYDGERFFGYGGNDPTLREGPAELDLTCPEEALSPFYVPEEYWHLVAEGASWCNLLNPNAFTCAVLCVDQVPLQTAAKLWREKIHRQQWQGGKPEQLLMMDLDSRCILMVLGKPQMVRGMENAAKKVFAKSRLLCRDGLAGR